MKNLSHVILLLKLKGLILKKKIAHEISVRCVKNEEHFKRTVSFSNKYIFYKKNYYHSKPNVPGFYYL